MVPAMRTDGRHQAGPPVRQPVRPRRHGARRTRPVGVDLLLAGALLPILLAIAGLGAAPAWNALGSDQRALLAPFETVWPRLDDRLRQQLLQNAAHWQDLDPPAQARLLARLQEWEALPAALRQRIRDRYQAYQRLDPALRAQLGAQYTQWRSLGAGRRDVLRRRFEALPAAERQALLAVHAPTDGAAVAARVFAFVPADERRVTLQMVAALDDQARERLLQLSARMAPWQREALRQELLALPDDAARAAHLQRSMPGR
jgi:hypothetical protein